MHLRSLLRTLPLLSPIRCRSLGGLPRFFLLYPQPAPDDPFGCCLLPFHLRFQFPVPFDQARGNGPPGTAVPRRTGALKSAACSHAQCGQPFTIRLDFPLPRLYLLRGR